MVKGKFFLTAVLMSVLMTGCFFFDSETHIVVEEEQLYGKWQEGSSQVYWHYNDDGTGVTWDEGEEISEEESNLTYQWTVSGDVLTHVFSGSQANQAVPKVYTITAIDNRQMVWKDDYGMTKTLTKVNGEL